MIYSRYIALHIHKGAALVLLILVSISVFFTFTQQVDNLGRGSFGGAEFAEYLVLRIPATIVDFVPLAALLGAMLSLGQLASNSELIALNAAGLSLRQLILAVFRASLLLAIVSALIAEFVAPYSETRATRLKSSSIQSNVSLQAKTGIWIRDERNIVYIGQLFPNGNALQVQVFELAQDQDKLLTHSLAASATVEGNGWVLKDVKQSQFFDDHVGATRFDLIPYEGTLARDLLQSLVIDPEQMSVRALNSYVDYLRNNGLNYQAESLFLWKKIAAPLSVMVLSLMAIPFVTGSQRQGNAGQRLMIGIMLGLAFTVLNSVLIQVGEQFGLWPPLNAVTPTLLFLLITVLLIKFKSAQS